MKQIPVFLFFLLYFTLTGVRSGNAAIGSVTVTSHDTSIVFCTFENTPVYGTFIFDQDETPTGKEGPTEYCSLQTDYRPSFYSPTTNRTHGILLYAVDGGEYQFIKYVESPYPSGDWTQLGEVLNFWLEIDISLLEPGQHTLSLVLQDIFGTFCYVGYIYGWSSNMSKHEGDIIDEATIDFYVHEEGGMCCGDAWAALVKECAGEGNIVNWNSENCTGDCINSQNLGPPICRIPQQ